MIKTGFETRVKVQQIIESQLPEFVLDESPKAAEFLKQYYISQEYQGGPSDVVENLDQYLKVDNLTPEVVVDSSTLSNSISSDDTTIEVSNTKGFPQKYGLLKIDNEIITYTDTTATSFVGCIRGFSGITTYHSDSNPGELVFETTTASSHSSGVIVENLSSLFLREFYKKLKFSLAPGLEDLDFVDDLNVGNFIKESKSFYKAKGTDESFKILFNILYGVNPKVINLEDFLIKPSFSEFLRREVVVAEAISGDPTKLIGQTIRQSDNSNIFASVSSVDLLSRQGITYYQLSLFIGYNDDTINSATFDLPGRTLVVENAPVGSTVITVDSTIGFSDSGTLIVNGNKITYSSKSVNQFYGCSNVTDDINVGDSLRSDLNVYGYENGDLTKKVELRLTGVIASFFPISEKFSVEKDDSVYVQNLGELIRNPSEGKTYKQKFANSWIYNTSSRYQVDSIDGSAFVLKSKIDKSSLKIGDEVEILIRDSETVVSSPDNIPFVQVVNNQVNQIVLSNLVGFVFDPTLKYDVRRKLKKASSSKVPFEFGAKSITSDIQNVYNENDEHMYVASNSLPSYTITKDLFEASISEATEPRLQNYDVLTESYSIISFPSNVPFITGDEVYYSAENDPIPGLENGGIYYVEVLSDLNQIKLYISRSFIGSINNITYKALPPNSGSHNFILNSQKNGVISPQKILRKFPLTTNIADGKSDDTVPGTVGVLINGVEINNYKSEDRIYYGPIDSVTVLNKGNNYDVINPPLFEFVDDTGVGAKIQPVIRGTVERVIVDPQDIGLESIVSIALTGGNGNGASFSPVLNKQQFREIDFSAKLSSDNGGVDVSFDTISFLEPHLLNNGDLITYNKNGNEPLGVGTFDGSNVYAGQTLVDNASYYAEIINDTTVRLYENSKDLAVGVNTVGFSEHANTGIHKFKTADPKVTLQDIVVSDSGSLYENRKLIVKPSGISTHYNKVIFKNHGFSDGDLVRYEYETSPIVGLSSNTNYRLLKIDSDSFRLCEDITEENNTLSNYERKKHINLQSNGSGYQYFKYPDIEFSISYSSVGVGTTGKTVGIITATPVIRGEIVDAYLYESGSNYGSKILNFHRKPTVTIKNGKNAELKPLIVNGSVTKAIIQYGGTEYYSTPKLTVIGDGSGAELRPVISNGKIIDVIVTKSGIGYSAATTSILVESSGINGLIDASVRNLTVDKSVKYGVEILDSGQEGIQYSVTGYDKKLQTEFKDTDSSKHSPIIGWSYDGNPIYGPYGYSDPEDINSASRILTTGYILDPDSVVNRPSDFSPGFFVEDYRYSESGDLDEHNGRFCKTPEFPNGAYVYFASVNNENVGISSFPYFIGNNYRSPFIKDNSTLSQSFDFNNTNLIRNTFPYKLNDSNAGNDFVFESYEYYQQEATIESVLKSPIYDTDIIGVGTGYKVKDEINFDSTGTDGEGFRAAVSKITGKDITNLNTTIDSYDDAVIVRDTANSLKIKITPYHNLLDRDYIALSGLTTSLTRIKKLNQIGITTVSTFVSVAVPSNSLSGLGTDVYVNEIPENVSIGSSVKIGSEFTTLLNIFPEQKILRVKRNVGSSHTVTTPVYFEPDTFTISESTDYFDSRFNDKVFFKPSEAIGFGASVGVNTTTVFSLGISTTGIATYTRPIETQSIYIKDHPFIDNQEVIFTVPDSYSKISVSNSTFGSSFNLPLTGSSQKVFISNKTKNTIGIKTTRSSSDLFFLNDGGTADSYEYSIESNFEQVKSTVQKIKTTVSVSTYHGLKTRDQITLQVNPSKTVGVQTFSSVYVKFDEDSQNLLIDPVGFGSESINTQENLINLISHEFKTGDKVYYKSDDVIASGLNTGSYYIYKFDDNNIKLSDSYIDSITNPPITVSIGSTGGSLQELSLINPELVSVRNNSLKFDLSDSSLNGYDFNLYFDEDFEDQFLSVESSTNFVISGVGTIGVSTNASLTLNYLDDIPQKLFYAAKTPSGYISTSDREVINSSQINFKDSLYNGNYEITGVGETTFDISLTIDPEVLSYSSSECDILKYDTTSLSADGGISAVKILSSGSKYNKLPTFIGSNSQNGTGGYVVAKSDDVGKINQIAIANQGFEYPSDKTLKPVAFISPFITLESSYKINSIGITSTGSGYSYPPDVLVVDSTTREVFDSGFIQLSLNNNSIGSAKIIETPYGISANETELITINNDNGYSINTIEASSGLATCYLSTPVLGFRTPPFSVGDKIFVEGIKNSDSGTGYNSSDYGYRFFTVTAFNNVIPATVEFSVSGLSTNPGTAKTTQEGLPTIVNYKDYPQFSVDKDFATFLPGESLLVYINGKYIDTDLEIVKSTENSIKIFGNYVLNNGDKIKGKKSGVIASISSIEENFGNFNVDSKLRKDFGWKNDVGKLNDDRQFIPDNDYYQNLSYSVKSPIEYEVMSIPVNRLLHTSGMKNFADTEIKEQVSSGIKTFTDSSFAVLDFIHEQRVDQIRNFDFALDIDSQDNKTKFIKLENKKLTSYIDCVSNRVLQIDDIKSRFSNIGLEESDQNIIDNDDEYFGGFARYLVQIVDTDKTEYQINDVVVIGDRENNFLLEKLSLTNQELPIATIDGGVDLFENNYIAFNPVDPYNKDYDIKILSNKFASDLVGVGTTSIGLVNLTSTIQNVSAGTTTSLVSFSADEYSSLYFNIYSRNTISDETNYSEIYVNHDGTDVYISEYFFNTDESTSNISLVQIGEFDASLSNGTISLDFTNNTEDSVRIGVKCVGFGTGALGIGTYRFKNEEQTDETERTAIYETNYSNSSGITTVVSASRDLFTTIKSTLNLSIGSTSALYQTAILNESGGDTYMAVYQPLSIGSISGIGTFGSQISGSNVELVFYPDSSIVDNVEISSFSELLYTDYDLLNLPDDLEYGTIKESHSFIEYGGINGDRVNRKDFDLYYDKTPIFEKTFNPSKSSVLDPTTGIFTIKNHFFNTGEELIYTPDSTLSDITAVGISTAAGILSTTVYTIKLTEDTFKLAPTKDLANSGIGVTFTSIGAGNAHKLEMTKKLEKSLITIDDLVQYPVTYTLVSHTLENNYGGSVGVGTTYISLSGISSIKSGDLLKVEDEFMKVINVGYGETSLGPITGIGSTNLVYVERGSVGTGETNHADLLTVDVYRGSYNLNGNKIHFTDAPSGDFRSSRDESNLNYFKSNFTGRVFLRQDYTTNQLYDNISESFTGIGQTYTLTVSGLNTVGLGTEGGNGIVFINNMFQAPTSDNNPNNNFGIIEDTNVGISSIVFSGSSADPGEEDIISAYDVNENQLPRGGVIVSLGSTGGLGIAPLVGASVTAILDGSGSITAVGVGTTDVVGSGYYGTVSVGVTDSNHSGTEASITATVGAGGSLSFTVSDGGSGYTNPIIQLPSPSYSNLPVQGVSRLGVGATTDVGTGLLLNLEVGASSTTGIGSTLHEVKSFKIVRNGYGFNLGDVITPVGLVTEKGIPNPLSEFELTVTDTFTDSFAAWQFGELDYIDSVKIYQDGIRTRFPLYYDGSLLSFQKDEDSVIDLNSVLIVYVNGVLQEPNVSYTFNGGSSFAFNVAPGPEDLISIFFYRGTKGQDSSLIEINESIKVGDSVKLQHNNAIPNTIDQNIRDVSNLPTSDKIETNIYNGTGIDQTNRRPLALIKQKVDKIINNEFVYKSRDSIESQVVPTTKIIYDLNDSDSSIYVDNAQFFNYEENESSLIIPSFDAIIVDNSTDLVSASISATVSSSGIVDSLTINDGGSGYAGTSIGLKLSAPRTIGVGIGTTATATASITAGIITSVTITNPGFGYSVLTPPQVIAPLPNISYENITGITGVEGFSGIITGISTTIGTIPNTTFTITVSGGVYYINGVEQDTISLLRGNTYIFDQSDSSNSNHPIRLSTTSDGTHNSGTQYTDGWTYTGTAGTDGEGTFVVPLDAPDTLYYYCANHSGMGGTANIDELRALQFDLSVTSPTSFTGTNLSAGYVISIFDTVIGSGVTSIDNSDSETVGIGSTFFDNVYKIHTYTGIGATQASIICHVMDSPSLSGIDTFGYDQLGKFSWGRLYGFSRSTQTTPISIGVTGKTVNSGLTTFPTIQRRGYGLRDTGALRKDLG